MANDVYQLKILGHDSKGNQFNNVLCYSGTNVANGPDPFLEAERLINAWVVGNENNYTACLPIDSFVDYYTCRRLNNGGGNTALIVSGASGSQLAGSYIGIGGFIKLTTSVAKVLGKIFLPGIWDGAVEGDVIQPAYKAVMTALAVSLAGNVVTTTDVYYISVWRKVFAVSYAAVDIIPSVRVGSQRKRATPVY